MENPIAPKSKMTISLKDKKLWIIVGVVAVVLLLVVVLGVVLFGGNKSNNKIDNSNTANNTAFDFNQCIKDNTKPGEDSHVANDICMNKQAEANQNSQNLSPNGTIAPSFSPTPMANIKGDPNSTDPKQKGLALSDGQCEGIGSMKLTHAPMNIKDVSTIQPMGAVVGGHVTPIDHEYYYQANQNAPKDTYPVYADGDGLITIIEDDFDGVKEAWRLTIAHSCTFLSIYNLLTSVTPEIKAKLAANYPKSASITVKIPVKAGDLLGYVGGQSLDYQLADTTTQLKGFLNPIAYNNREPWKVNTVRPLDYFTESVKSEVLTKYIKTVEPRDGKIDYDVDGQAIGTWFVQGTNGYAGSDSHSTTIPYYVGHLSLAPDSIDPSGMIFSIGDFKGQPTQFAVKNIDFTKITPTSGIVKIELFQRSYITSAGATWTGQYATGIKLSSGPSQATALIQMTDNQIMKVEVFSGKTPAQVTGFTSAAKIYNRGQDAHLIINNGN